MSIIGELMAGIGRMFQRKEEEANAGANWFKMRVYNDDFLKGEDSGYFDIDLIAVVKDTALDAVIMNKKFDIDVNQRLAIANGTPTPRLVNFAHTNCHDAVILEDFPHFEQLIPPKPKKGQTPQQQHEAREKWGTPRTGEQIRIMEGINVELIVSVYSGTFAGCEGKVELLDPNDKVMFTFDFNGIEDLHTFNCIHIASLVDHKFTCLVNGFATTKQCLNALGVELDTSEMYADQKSPIPHPAWQPRDGA